MNLLRKVSNIFDRTCDLAAILAAVLLMLIFVLVNSEVITRSITAHSIVWVIEICEFCLFFITFLGTAWLLRRDGHVKIDLVVSQLNPRHQALVKTITSIISTISCLVVTWYSAKVTWACFQTGFPLGTGLMPPAFIILSVMPVGSFLLSIQFLRITYGHVSRWKALQK